jgi:3-oxoacyl-[acyl-carrier-protein] synthase-3
MKSAATLSPWGSDARDFVGIPAMGYYLPPAEETVRQVVSAGQTNSDEAKLTRLGFETIRIADEDSVVQMAIEAVRNLRSRSGFDLDRVDVVVYAGALATSSVIAADDQESWGSMSDPTPLFRFPGPCLQSELGIPNASVIGVTQLACNSFQAALRVARALILAERSVSTVLCVAADRFPANARREIVYNLMSDGACAAIVSRGEPANRVLATGQITRGAYWDSTVSHDQLIAAYFPLARRVILEALEAADLEVDELDLLIPHNLNLKSWEILAQVVGIPIEKIYTANIARIGHVVASDNVINYLDALDAGCLKRGDKVALFVMGFGAHWSCSVLEV